MSTGFKEPVTLLEKILRQIEYYFSDVAYPYDDFLQGKTVEGFVPLSLIASFPKVKALTEDLEVLKSAVKDSQDVRLSDDGTGVGRLWPLPKDDKTVDTSVFVDKFAAGTEESALKDMMNQFGTVVSVRLLRDLNSRELNGSAFVEFENEAAASSAVEAAAGGSLQHSGGALVVVLKRAHFALQEKAILGKRKTRALKQNPEVKYEPGQLLRFTGTGDGADREAVQAAVQHLGAVKYMDFAIGRQEGVVRFKEAVAAKAAEELNTAKCEIGGAVPSWEALSGEAEKEYWIQVHKGKKDAKKNWKSHNKKPRHH